MKLATWNVNTLKHRMPRVLEFLELHPPDTLFLQETKTKTEAFPGLELAAAGYETVHHTAGRWAAVIAARHGTPVEERGGLRESRRPTRRAGSRRRSATCARAGVCPERAHCGFADLRAEAAVPGRRASASASCSGRRSSSPATSTWRPRPRRLRPGGVRRRHTRHAAERYRSAPLLAAGRWTPTALSIPKSADSPGGTTGGPLPSQAGAAHRLVLLSPQPAERLRVVRIDRNFRKGPKPSDHAPLLAELR